MHLYPKIFTPLRNESICPKNMGVNFSSKLQIKEPCLRSGTPSAYAGTGELGSAVHRVHLYPKIFTPLRNKLICPKNVGAGVAMNFI